MSWAEIVIRDMHNERINNEVLIELQSRGPCTAYHISNCLKIDRSKVSRSLQRLKRKGLVSVVGQCWRYAK